MHTKAAMNGGAINAEEDPVRHRRPRGVLRVAIEAHLVLGLGFELLEDGVLVGVVLGGHGGRIAGVLRVGIGEEERKEQSRDGWMDGSINEASSSFLSLSLSLPFFLSRSLENFRSTDQNDGRERSSK